jgi:hypothetical protein
MIKAEGIELGSEQALFTAYFDNVDGTDADNNGFVDRAFREIRDETDIGNNPNN